MIKTPQAPDVADPGDCKPIVVTVAAPTPTPKPTPISKPTEMPTPCATPGTGSNPCSNIVARTPSGVQVLDFAKQTVYRPDDGHDPAFFTNQGLLAAADNVYGEKGSTFTSLAQLVHFATGQAWDEQRVCGGNPDKNTRSYASIMIGIYAAAAGIPIEKLLFYSNAFASIASNFRGTPVTAFDSKYTHLPKINVENEKLGYHLEQIKAFNVCPLFR